MSWIFVDKEKGGEGEMRQQMRRNMRSGNYRNYGGGGYSMRDNYDEGYRQGYRHGWEDSEDDGEEMRYHRSRDSRGRFI